MGGSNSADYLNPLPYTGKTVWVDSVYGNDTTGVSQRSDLPFLTLTAAKAAASSGDTEVVRPGTYNQHNIGKNGVASYYLPGASVSYTGASDGAIFDDSASGTNGAIACTVAGSGVFDFQGTSGGIEGVIYMTNPASDIAIQCRSINSFSGVSQPTIDQEAGTLSIKADRIGSDPGIITLFWTNGPSYISADVLTGSWPIWSEVANGATVTGDLHVDARRIETNDNYGITLNDNNASARAWIHADIITGSYQGIVVGASNVANGAKYYITAQKITHNPTDAGPYGTVQVQSGNLYLTTQKMTQPDRASDCGIFTSGTGTAFVSADVPVMEHLGACLNMVAITNANATFDLQMRRCIGTATTGGVKATAGSLSISNSRIDTSANSSTSPILVSGSPTVILQNVFLKAEGTQPSIKNSDAGAHTVYCYGCRTNRDVDTGITIIGDLLVDATFA